MLQIASFYGATNDELSQPRCCWDHSGKYVYGVSATQVCITHWAEYGNTGLRKIWMLEGHNGDRPFSCMHINCVVGLL